MRACKIIAFIARDGETLKDASVTSYVSRLVLDPAVEIVSSTTRKVFDGLNTLCAERYEHQCG